MEKTSGELGGGLRRVAITGIGVVSPSGEDPRQCYEQLLSGVSSTTAYAEDNSPVLGLKAAALVKDFDAGAVVGKKNIKRSARFLQMGLAAARAARVDSALDAAGYPTARVGCLFGSSLGGMDIVQETAAGFLETGMRGVSPFLLPGALNNMVAGMITIDSAINGPCYAVSASWASSTLAIGQAFEMIRHGAADAMVVGGSESLSNVSLSAMVLARGGLFIDSVEEDGSSASRPFDATRRGVVAAEGAAMLILEDLDKALARGVKPYAEILGYASAFAPTATTKRNGWQDVMVNSMRNALNAARVNASDIGYINAYGSSSRVTDVMENHAVKAVFNGAAKDLWISSNKGAIGHLLGGSGAFEVAMTGLSLQRGVFPPTANLRQADPDCDLDYMPGDAREKSITYAMKNTFSESGHSASLILRSVI